MFLKLEINDFRLFKDKSIQLGQYLTILSGRNSTGKSTILGMLANSTEFKKAKGKTYSGKMFRGEFSELFKGSKTFDTIGPHKFKITVGDVSGKNNDWRTFRTAWQKKKLLSNSKNNSTPIHNNNAINQEERFRIIPYKKLDGGKKTEAKFDYPVIYLGLSRLFPIGESKDTTLLAHKVIFETIADREWFIKEYTYILSLDIDVSSVNNISIGETDKKVGIGINTIKYDYLTNSSGQDNLGQILLSILSLKKLKEKLGDEWKGALLLIDEIDTTLHPSAQIRLCNLLIRMAREHSIQVVITTHSISILEDISYKIKYNKNNSDYNNIELYYLTTANRKLEIKRNPAIHEIKNDLLVTSIVTNQNKIKLYTEDPEARWFLKHLIPDYLKYLDILEAHLGAEQIMSFYSADISYFANNMIILDGDKIHENILKKVKMHIEKFNNVIMLPGEKRPEQVIYEYISSLNPEHPIWSGPARNFGFSWTYFKDNGPFSDKYNRNTDREKYKSWFNDHQDYFDSINLMDYWNDDNKETVNKFIESFIKSYNSIAERTLAIPLPI